MRRIRKESKPVDVRNMGGLLQEVQDDDTHNFNHEWFGIKAKDGILYTYIIKELNKTLR